MLLRVDEGDGAISKDELMMRMSPAPLHSVESTDSSSDDDEVFLEEGWDEGDADED